MWHRFHMEGFFQCSYSEAQTGWIFISDVQVGWFGSNSVEPRESLRRAVQSLLHSLRRAVQSHLRSLRRAVQSYLHSMRRAVMSHLRSLRRAVQSHVLLGAWRCGCMLPKVLGAEFFLLLNLLVPHLRTGGNMWELEVSADTSSWTSLLKPWFSSFGLFWTAGATADCGLHFIHRLTLWTKPWIRYRRIRNLMVVQKKWCWHLNILLKGLCGFVLWVKPVF